MSDISIWGDSARWLEIVFNVLLIVLPTLAGAAALTVGGLRTLKLARDAWRLLRPLVDQPTDTLVRLIAQQTGRPAEQVSEFLTGNLDKVVSLFPLEETIK